MTIDEFKKKHKPWIPIEPEHKSCHNVGPYGGPCKLTRSANWWTRKITFCHVLQVEVPWTEELDLGCSNLNRVGSIFPDGCPHKKGD